MQLFILDYSAHPHFFYSVVPILFVFLYTKWSKFGPNNAKIKITHDNPITKKYKQFYKNSS